MGKNVILDFVKTEKNVADPLTNILSWSAVLDTLMEMWLNP